MKVRLFIREATRSPNLRLLSRMGREVRGPHGHEGARGGERSVRMRGSPWRRRALWVSGGHLAASGIRRVGP